MKLKPYLFLIVLLVLPALACTTSAIGTSINGSGNIITKTYEVADFSGVTLAGFGDVYITQGETEGLSVETDDNIFAELDIRVSGDELILGTKPNVGINPSKSIIYHLTVKDLKNIELAGSGNIYSEPLQSGDMRVSVAGSGNIEINGLDATRLSIRLPGSGNITIEQLALTSVDTSINGSGDIRLDGKSDTQSIDLNGSGTYIAGDLETTDADISVSGSGNLTVWATDNLNIHVNGSGDVSYYGHPIINQTGGGSGDVISLGKK